VWGTTKNLHGFAIKFVKFCKIIKTKKRAREKEQNHLGSTVDVYENVVSSDYIGLI
jgi:hypothetical protein